jgi:two-component system KDP operon response regulator KdpE
MYSQSKILLLGSDHEETRRVANSLTMARHEVITVSDWKSGLRNLYSQQPNALIVCSASEGADDVIGWAEVQLVRSLCDLPVIVVADRATRGALRRAIDLGLAGFLERPLDIEGLHERLNTALERPSRVNGFPKPEFRRDNLCIDWRRFEVKVDGQIVRLSPIEFKLLALLVEREGEVVTHGEILARVWGSNYDLADRRNVKLYVWYLRKKLERDPSRPRWIVTRNGLGYIFDGDTEPAEEAPQPRVVALATAAS